MSVEYHVWEGDDGYTITKDDIAEAYNHCIKSSTWKQYLDATMRDADTLSSYTVEDSCLTLRYRRSPNITNIDIELRPTNRSGSFVGFISWSSINVCVKDIHSALEVWFDTLTAIREINLPSSKWTSCAVLKNVELKI